MESPQSYVQHRRGSCAFGPEDTVTGVNIGNAILQTSKLEWTQQRRRIVDDDEDAALARSSSFDSQALHGPQPRRDDTCRHPCLRATKPIKKNGAAVDVVSDTRQEGWNKKPGSATPTCASHALGDFAVQRQNLPGGRLARKLRARPSSAQESSTNAQLVYQTTAFGGKQSGLGDPVQASFFPVLGGEDGVPDEYHGSNANFGNDNATSGDKADHMHHISVPATSRSRKIKDTRAAYNISRSLILKPSHQRERGVGQPFRAHPTPSPPRAANGGRRNGELEEREGSTSTGGVQATENNNMIYSRNPLTPRSLALATETGARVVVGHATSIQAVAANTIDGNYPGSGSSAASHRYNELRQHCPSANNSATTSPRVSSPPRYSPSSGNRVVASTDGRQSATHTSSSFISHSQALDGAARGTGTGNVGSCGNMAEEMCNDGLPSKNVGTGEGSSPVIPSRGGSSSTGSGDSRLEKVGIPPPLTSSCSSVDQPRIAGVEGVIEEESGGVALLPGPKGGVEVRELGEGVIVVRRSELEKRRCPERLNLHRRQLKSCPLIEGDSQLRLLSYQNNFIKTITNMANLPNLIFLDLYNNLIETLEGPLASIIGLRVVMVGKNKIQKISNLESLRKLDVLDLHSNDIRDMEGFDALQELRVLNLAGNKLSMVENVSCLTALTELNLRRNTIKKVMELDVLPRLQRLFLSNNKITSFDDCQCIFSVGSLLELSLDGNPVAGQNGAGSRYRRFILQRLPSLHHLDLKRVTNDDQSFPLNSNDTAIAQNRNHDSVRVKNSSASQPATATSWIICKNSFSDTKTITNEATLPDLKNINENRRTKDDHSSNNSPRRVVGRTTHVCAMKEGRCWSSEGTMGKGDARQYQCRTGAWMVTPRAPGGTGGTSSLSSPCRDGKRNSNLPEERCKQASVDCAGMVIRSLHLPPRVHLTITIMLQTGGVPAGSEQVRHYEIYAGCTQVLFSTSGCAGTGSFGATENLAIKENEAVSAKVSQAGREDREMIALKERGDAIDAARKCWERRKKLSGASGTRRQNRHSSIVSTCTSSGGSNRSYRRTLPTAISNSSIPHNRSDLHPASSSTCSFAPPDRRGFSTSKSERVSGGSSANTTGKGLATRNGRRSKDLDRSVGVVSGGMGYFELEQRVPEDGIRFGAACALEPGITLNVYGDVWRWLSDEKVCLLKEKVFQVQFLYVHVDSVARKAAAIAQTFHNLTSLRLLDNDIRSFEQLEQLRPLVVNLVSLDLGHNPVATSASEVALQAWVQAQGPRLRLAIASHETIHVGPEEQLERRNHSSHERLRSDSTGSSCPFVGEQDNERGESLPGFLSSFELGAERIAEANLASASVAFARLADAREQAKDSSWGSVALTASWGMPGQQRKLPTTGASAEAGSTWAASARAAKLACNITMRKVCEAHRKDVELDRAWNAVIERMVQDVLAAAGEQVARVSPFQEHSPGNGDQVEATSTSFRHLRSPAGGCTNDIGTRNAIRTHPPFAKWLNEI